MTLPKALPLDHPRVEQFRTDLEDVLVVAFEEGVHVGILMANAHRVAAMLLVGLRGTREQFMTLALNAWDFAIEEKQVLTALEEASKGNGHDC